MDPNRKLPTEFVPDAPTDLASLYAQSGGVDLDILSELTKSVAGTSDGDLYPSRSKRTCVRVRQEITKLQEILKDNGDSESKPSPVGVGSKGKGRGKGKVSSARNSDAGLQDVGGGNSPTRKYKRPAYSQFTHKRKRKRKLPEEGKYYFRESTC